MNEKDLFYDRLDIAFSIGRYTCRVLKLSLEHGQRSFPSHRHGSNSWELHYIAGGKARITLNQVPHIVTEGSFFITGPNVEHSQIPDTQNPMVEYCAYYKLEEKGRSDTKTPGFLERLLATPAFLCQDTEAIKGLMTQLFQELSQMQTGYLTEMTALFTQLLVHAARNISTAGELPGTTAATTATTLSDRDLLIIEECFLYQYKTLTLEELAAALGLSTRQTERRLKQHYSKTFLQMKSEARMSAAMIRLEKGTETIAEIAEEMGYSTPEHFSAAFRAGCKMSPREFRKAALAKQKPKYGASQD